MKYAIITYGSRGDVQPYVALSLGLIGRGHQVTLLAPENFKTLAEGYGVPFYPLAGNVEALLYSPEGLRVLKTGNALSLLRYLQKGGTELQPLVNEGLLAGSADADILITSVLPLIWVRNVAEKFNKKWGIVQVNFPAVPTKQYPFAGLAFFNSPYYNLFTYWLVRYFYWKFNKKSINQFRETLGLKALGNSAVKEISNSGTLDLYAISPQLVARPGDWKSNTDITGYITLPEEIRENQATDQIPSALEEWLQNDEKPIYIGFGSIPVPDTALLCNILNNLLQNTTHRIVFCIGWSVVEGLPDHPRLFVVKYVNHQWLFPKCKTAVIHGGAGTTAAVLKAKIPVIIVSIFADQPWWGKIIQNKNLGVHIPFKQLNAKKLLKAIARTEEAGMIKNAIENGEQINLEDGLKTVLDRLEKHFG